MNGLVEGRHRFPFGQTYSASKWRGLGSAAGCRRITLPGGRVIRISRKPCVYAGGWGMAEISREGAMPIDPLAGIAPEGSF